MRFHAPGFVAVLAAFVLVTAARADVRIEVSPESLVVAPGETFTVALQVPAAGAVFNGYDAIVEFDPTQLTFVPTSPYTLQEGASMRAACGNTFFLLQSAGDSVSISHVLLCGAITLPGPAQLCLLKFRASLAAAGASQIRLRRVQFYSEGLFVNPAITRDGFVRWGAALDVPGESPVPGIRLTIRGNPGRGDQWIDVGSPVGGQQELAILDSAGRVVRRLDSGDRPSGVRSVRWDGRDSAGRNVPPGVYSAYLRAGGSTARAALVRLP